MIRTRSRHNVEDSRSSRSRESVLPPDGAEEICKSNLARLLDHLSDQEDDDAASVAADGLYPVAVGGGQDEVIEDEDVVIEVEDLLLLAMKERRGRREAKHVLSQLQENYDTLQRKYAQAENIIDKYR